MPHKNINFISKSIYKITIYIYLHIKLIKDK
jgi:hypothetical protein